MVREIVKVDVGTHSPILTIDASGVIERSGMSGGPELARLDIVDDKGAISRFWVSAVIKNGRPVVTVSTKRLSGDQHDTRITGVFNPQN